MTIKASYVLPEVIMGTKPTPKAVVIKSTVTGASQLMKMSKAGSI